VLGELAEEMSAHVLVEAVERSPISWAQRLGYLLETLGREALAAALLPLVRGRAHSDTPLRRAKGLAGGRRNSRWRLIVNTDGRGHAPWKLDAQVDQDLVISRALVEIFRAPGLADSLAFRGATALYKLHLLPPARYSEDIDLVQVTPGSIGPTLKGIRAGPLRPLVRSEAGRFGPQEGVDHPAAVGDGLVVQEFGRLHGVVAG